MIHTDLLNELVKSKRIIEVLLNNVPDKLKSGIANQLSTEGICDEGMTRANERDQIIKQATEQLPKIEMEFRRLKGDFINMSNDQIKEQNEFDLKEMAHWYGGFDELRKIIDRLEENANDAAYERSLND